jgi:soluble lytic murein transglycosylase-like protein
MGGIFYDAQKEGRSRWQGDLGRGSVSAQVGADAPSAGHPEVDQKAVPTEPQRPTANPPTADDVCRTLEEAAAENGLPVEFFARVIWQESRFNARAVSPKGASGIAQFMPQTAGWHGLADPGRCIVKD